MASTSTNRTPKSVSSGRGRGGRRPINISNLPPEEAQKREKRRERNKIAAARCRQRKLDHANTLVEQAYCLEAEHERLATQLQSMLQHVHSLKRTIDQHEGPLESACRDKRLKFDGQFDLMMLNYEAMNEAMRPLLPDEEEEMNTTTEAEDSAVEIKIEDDDEENDSQISSSNEAWEANVNIFSSNSFQQQQNAASFKQSEPVGLCVLSTESKESQPNQPQESFPWNSWANKLNPITFPLPTNSLDVPLNSLLQTHENKQQEDLMMTSNNNRSSCSSQESVVYQREQESSFTLSLRDSFIGANESSMTKPNRPNSLQVLGFGMNLNAMSSNNQSETTFVPETTEFTALATPTLSTDALQTPTSGFLLDNWNSISGLLALSSPIVPTSNNLMPSSSTAASGTDALTPNTLDAFVRSFASP